jgi:hypothetical protein
MLAGGLEFLGRLGIFLAGGGLVIYTLMSEIRTLVLPRASRTWLVRGVFRGLQFFFDLRLRRATSYDERDRVMAYYGPLGLLSLPFVWLTLVLIGYTAMFWAAVPHMSLHDAFLLSGSSLLTLGFRFEGGFISALLEFSEAMLGLILVALLVGYLPTIYGAFSRRETLVTLLEIRAGSPPSIKEMLARFHRTGFLYNDGELGSFWQNWEQWFVEIEETHTTFPALNFFRSPSPQRSWITAAGVVLDTAAFINASVETSLQIHSRLTIRAGFVSLRAIADYFQMDYDRDPRPDAPISISRAEFDELYNEVYALGVPLKPDREACWRDFAGWRVNYDSVLLQLALFTRAPYAAWVSDRSLPTFGWPRRPEKVSTN